MVTSIFIEMLNSNLLSRREQSKVHQLQKALPKHGQRIRLRLSKIQFKFHQKHRLQVVLHNIQQASH